MADLVRREDRSVARKSDVSAPGAGQRVEDTEWTGTLVTVEDLGFVWPTGFGAVVTSGGLEESQARKRPDGTFYRRRTGWLATRSGIVIGQRQRVLLPQPDGRLRFDDDWSKPTYRHLEAAEVPRRRVGDVPIDQHATDAEDTPVTSASSNVGRGEGAASFLPSPVRRSVGKVSNPPKLYDGEALRHERVDRSVFWTVSLLKLNDAGAVVVQAARQEGAATWQVEQVTYRFTVDSAPTTPRGEVNERR